MWWKVMKVSALREEIELDNEEDLDGSEFPDCFGFFGFQKEGGRLLGFRKHGFHIKSLIKGFIKFLYGFELTDEDIDLNTSKELLKMGDMYEVKGLSKQSCYLIKNLLTKENVFENLSFCKKINSEKGVKICCKFIAKHFNKNHLISEGKLKEHPEIAVLLVENELKNEDDIGKSVMRIPGPIVDSFHERKFYISRFRFRADTDFTITGIGVFLAPEDEVEINIKITKLNEPNERLFASRESYINKYENNCIPIKLKNQVKIEAESITEVVTFLKFPKKNNSIQYVDLSEFIRNEDDENSHDEGVFEVKADGRNRNSQFVKIVNFRIDYCDLHLNEWVT